MSVYLLMHLANHEQLQLLHSENINFLALAPVRDQKILSKILYAVYLLHYSDQ